MVSNDGENLVFLMSLPHAGSTLLSNLLGGHDRILSPPEPWFLLRLAELTDLGCTDNIYYDDLARNDTADFLSNGLKQTAISAFALTVYNGHLTAANKSIFVDKMPRYFHILPYIDTMFPLAKKIWVNRNPLDVAASYKRSWNIEVESHCGARAVHSSYDLAVGLFDLVAYLGDEDETKHRLSYEELVSDPVNVLQKLCTFLGVEFNPAMLAYESNADLMVKCGTLNAGDKNIHSTESAQDSSVGRWRYDLFPGEVQQVIDMLGRDVFATLGYSKTIEELRSLDLRFPGESIAAQRREAVRMRSPGKIGERSWRLHQCELDRENRLRLLEERGGENVAQRKVLKRVDAQSSTMVGQLRESQQRVMMLECQLYDLREQRTNHADQLRTLHEALSELLKQRHRLKQELQRVYDDPFAWMVANNTRMPRVFELKNKVEPGLVSVIIPAYNAESFLERAVESVLKQDMPAEKLEILICEDGSTDNTHRLAETLAKHTATVTVLTHPARVNCGVSATRNLGLRAARGEFVALLDADDLWLPHKTSTQIAFMRDHPDVHCVCSYGYNRDLEGNLTKGWNGSEIAGNYSQVPPPFDFKAPYDFEQFLIGDPVVNSTIMIRRSAIAKVGGYPEVMAHQAEDWLLVTKLSLLSPIHLIKKQLIYYTVHADSYTTRYFIEGLGYGVEVEFLFYLLHWMLGHPEHKQLAEQVYRKHYPCLFAATANTARLLEEYRRFSPDAFPSPAHLASHLDMIYKELADLREYHAQTEKWLTPIRNTPGARRAFRLLKKLIHRNV